MFKYCIYKSSIINQITPTFAKIKGTFGGLKDIYNVEKSILFSQLLELKMHLKKLSNNHTAITMQLKIKLV